MRTLSLGVMAWLGVMTTSFAAAAQDSPPATEPAPAQPASAAPATAAPAAATPATPAEPPDEGHFRWGLSPSIGTFFPGPTTLSFGLEARFGYAFNQMVTAYGSVGSAAGIGFGGDASANGASLSVSAISYWYIGANVDALVAGPLFVGAGAAIGRGGWGVVSQSASSAGGSQEVIAAGGTMPSADARIGLHVGKWNDKGKRPGFSIALDLRVLIAPDSASTKQSATATGGASQSVTTDTTAVGYSPMLMLGYDLR